MGRSNAGPAGRGTDIDRHARSRADHPRHSGVHESGAGAWPRSRQANDIWAFGCVLFEMLTGRAAFADETISDTLARVLDRDVDWHALPPSTPGRVRDLLRRCLQKERQSSIARHRRRASRDRRGVDSRRCAKSRSERPVGAGAPRCGRLAVLALAILGTTSYMGRARSESAPAFRQLTFRHGTITGARLAPDGQTVVYRATWSGARPELFLIRPESRQSGSIGLGNAGIFSVSSVVIWQSRSAVVSTGANAWERWHRFRSPGVLRAKW
jgi:serine/threonine protein kinase